MNRYSFVIGPTEGVVKDSTKRKVEMIKKQTVKKFGKRSIRDEVLSIPARKVPAPRIRGQRCHICGVRVNLLTGIGTCMGCDARITRIERGTEESVFNLWSVLSAIFLLTLFIVVFYVK